MHIEPGLVDPSKIALSYATAAAAGATGLYFAGQALRERGLLFVGIDVIDGWLTEINVTSPTGIQELERFDGINAAEAIWEAIERRVAAKG